MSKLEEKAENASSIDSKEIALKKRKNRNERQERKKTKKRETCAYCKKREASTTEHFIPKSSQLDLAFKKINLIPACKSCNLFKGGRWPNPKEISWFFEYWNQQLKEVESHLKIAEALKRNRDGQIEGGNDGRRNDIRIKKRRHRRRRVRNKSNR